MELAACDTLELSGKPTTATMDVHRLATARNQGNGFAETRQNGGQSPAQTKQPSNDPVRKSGRSCTRCGEQHDARTCPFRKAKCYGCNRIGHLHKMCRNANTHFVGEEGSELCDDNALGIHHITECGYGEGMELDTCAVVSVTSECLYREHLTHYALEPTQLKLQDYLGGI